MIKFIYNARLLGLFKNIDGITLYPFVLIKYNNLDVRSLRVRRHEIIHVEQIKRMGIIRFYLTYLFYHLKYGYEKNPLEIEAYEKQDF